MSLLKDIALFNPSEAIMRKIIAAQQKGNKYDYGIIPKSHENIKSQNI